MITIETNFEPYNLNDYVKVKLNTDGFSVWKLEYEKYLPVEYHEPLENYNAKADADGYVQFQMWVFIQLFGRYIYMAGPMLYDTTVLIQRPLPPLPPPRRPLSSLSDDEARECYRLAMGHDAKTWVIRVGNDVTVTDADVKSLHIHSDGVIYGEFVSGRPIGVFATPLVRYLDKLGIEIG